MLSIRIDHKGKVEPLGCNALPQAFGKNIDRVTAKLYVAVPGGTKGRMGRIFRLREDIVPSVTLGL